MIGLVLGGVVLLLLLLLGIGLLASNSDETDVATDSTSTTAGVAGSTASTGAGPTTSVAGTGAPSSVTSADVVKFLRDEQAKVTPDLRIGSITCPPSPYRVGHVVVCRMQLEDAPVLYRVEITGPSTVEAEPTKPIIDTNKAEALMEEKEPGATGDCGAPRVRQVDVGSELTCRTASNVWDFTVGPKGEVSGATR